MVKVLVRADDGNSPQKTLLQQVITAFAEGDIAFLTSSVHDDIVWHVKGFKTISGKTDFVAELHKINFSENETVSIERMITHGNEAAVSGEIVLTNGNTFSFCDFYEFSGVQGTLITVIESYNIGV